MAQVTQSGNSLELALENVFSVGLRSLEPTVSQAVTTALAPVMAMVSQLVRDVHDVKRECRNVESLRDQMSSLNEKMEALMTQHEVNRHSVPKETFATGGISNVSSAVSVRSDQSFEYAERTNLPVFSADCQRAIRTPEHQVVVNEQESLHLGSSDICDQAQCVEGSVDFPIKLEDELEEAKTTDLAVFPESSGIGASSAEHSRGSPDLDEHPCPTKRKCHSLGSRFHQSKDAGIVSVFFKKRRQGERRRAPFFSEEEVDRLRELVNQQAAHCFPGSGNVNAHQVRRKAWREITNRLNSEFGNNRDSQAVYKKFLNMNMKLKANQRKRTSHFYPSDYGGSAEAGLVFERLFAPHT